MRIDGHVPDLAGDAVGATEQAAAAHMTGADAGRDLHVGEVVDTSPRAPPAFRQRAQIRVVVHVQRHAERLPERLETMLALPVGQYDLGESLRLAWIHGTRQRDAHADETARARARLLEAGLAQLLHEPSRAVGIGAHRVLAVTPHEHLAAQIGECHRHVRRADLDAEDGAGLVLEAQHDRTASAARGTGADLGHERGRQQQRHDLGHGRARQIRAARDIGARDLTLLPDESQHGVRERSRTAGFGSMGGASFEWGHGRHDLSAVLRDGAVRLDAKGDFASARAGLTRTLPSDGEAVPISDAGRRYPDRRAGAAWPS